MLGSSRISFGTQTIQYEATAMGRGPLLCSCTNTHATLEPKGFRSTVIGAGEREVGMGQVKMPQGSLLFLTARHFSLINTH